MSCARCTVIVGRDGQRMDIQMDCPCRSPFAVDLDAVLAEVRASLIEKNAAYGDSALRPVRIFSRADPIEQLRVRIDDKLSRLARGSDAGEDTEADLLGYLVLLRIARLRGDRGETVNGEG